jgi:hypothetical protein
MSMEDFLFLYECTYCCYFWLLLFKKINKTFGTNGAARNQIYEMVLGNRK